MMAATAQLDCGQCGYLCQSYTEALAEGREASTSLCVPGGKATARLLKQFLAEAPAVVAPAVAATGPAKPSGRAVRVLSAQPLTGPGSAKDVRHVVIDLTESGLTYEPGDSIGLATPNDPALVTATIDALGATGDEPVPCPDGTARPLREAFATQYDIARPLDRTTDLLAMSGDASAPRDRVAPAFGRGRRRRTGRRGLARSAGRVSIGAAEACRPGRVAATAAAAAVLDRLVATGDARRGASLRQRRA